jgi:flagellar transcriptional activator FlhD
MEVTHGNKLQNGRATMAKQKDGVMPISDNTALSDIQEVNLSYLMLAQRLLRDNYAAGMYRLGFDSDVADIILGLSPAQLVRLASTNTLICGFRLNDYQLLSTLGQDVLGGVLQQAHSTILMAQRSPQQLA